MFAAVTAEVRKLVAVEMTAMGRYDPDGVVTMVGWSVTDPDPPPPPWTALGGRNVTTLAFETGRPARIDEFSTTSGAAAEAVRAMGVRATVLSDQCPATTENTASTTPPSSVAANPVYDGKCSVFTA